MAPWRCSWKRSETTTVGAGEDRLRVAVADLPVDGDVGAPGVDQDLAGERVLRVEHGVELVDVEVDLLGGRLRDRRVSGDDDRHRLADVAHAVAGDDRLQPEERHGRLLSALHPQRNASVGELRCVGGGERADDAGKRQRVGQVHPEQGTVGHRAPDDARPDLARPFHVRHVLAGARDQAPILRPDDAAPDCGSGRRGRHRAVIAC